MICERCMKEMALDRIGLAKRIAANICWELKVHPALISSESQTAELVQARRLIWWELVIRYHWSYPMAGRETGGHHHTTVMHGIRREAQERYGMPFPSKLTAIRAEWNRRHPQSPVEPKNICEQASVGKQATEQAA